MKLSPQKRSRLAALFLALLVLLTACDPYAQPEEAGGEEQPALQAAPEEESGEEEPEESHPFTLGYYENVTLNPYTCNNTTNQGVLRLLYEPLYEQSPDFSTHSVLAESLTPLGEGEWELTLPTGISFWNGEELTAGDVAASLLAAAGEGSIYQQRLAPLVRAEAAGAYTLTITWNEAIGDLAVLLEIPIVQAGSEGDRLPMGTGPYQPVLGEGGEVQALASFPAWWQGETLPVDRVELAAVSDSDMLIYGFESGGITLVSTDLTGTNSLGYTGSFEVRDYPTSYLLYLGCNTGRGLCVQAGFRRALQSALDRETIAQSLLSGHAQASPLLFHPDSPYYDGELAQSFSQIDTDGLKAYNGYEVRILVNTESSFRVAIAQFVADALTGAGLEARVDSRPWSGYQEALAEGDYDLYLGLAKLEPDFDLTSFFDPNGSLNPSGFSAGEITAALANYRSAPAEGRAAQARQLSRAVSQEAPVLPLCFLKHSILCAWGSVGDYAATQSNLFYHFQDWSLDQPAGQGSQTSETTEGRTAQ